MMHRPPFPSGWSHIALSPSNLTLANTLPVGQSFLWHRRQLEAGPSTHPTEEFSRAISNPPRVILLRQTSTHLYYTALHPHAPDVSDDLSRGTTKRWLEDYFQLDSYPDLPSLYAEWRKRDPDLFGRTELDDRAVGIRVLRQEPWECLVAFITSTNNHIPRITSLMHKLSLRFSPQVLTLDGHAYHLFPPPDALPADLEPTLRELGFGYRAGFIESSLASLRVEFGSKVEAELMSWRELPVDQVREKLLALKGVGRKVADCVMLMCLDQPSLIPVDTHVGAIAARHPSFPSRLRNKPMSKPLYDEIQAFLLDKWGPLGGWCQAVMFAADLPKPKLLLRPVPSVLEEIHSSPTLKLKRENNPPASHQFKRTRSATKVELRRPMSGLPQGVENLDVDNS